MSISLSQSPSHSLNLRLPQLPPHSFSISFRQSPPHSPDTISLTSSLSHSFNLPFTRSIYSSFAQSHSVTHLSQSVSNSLPQYLLHFSIPIPFPHFLSQSLNLHVTSLISPYSFRLHLTPSIPTSVSQFQCHSLNL